MLHSCIHPVIQAWAERAPAAVAVAAPGRAPFTYAHLSTHLEDVVQTLHTLGIGSNNRIALVRSHGPEMVVAFLATAAAAASAPVNPNYRAIEFDASLSDLLAALLVSRIRHKLHLELSVLSLFDAPTVADQAILVEETLLIEGPWACGEGHGSGML